MVPLHNEVLYNCNKEWRLYTAMNGLCNKRKKPNKETVSLLATFYLRKKWGYKYIQISLSLYIKKTIDG